jgi:hypothetical protein
MPISAPVGTWTFIDFPDSACDDGSPTGIGVNLAAGSKDVLVFFEGGGLCWDYNSCFTLNTALHGPFGAGQLAGMAASTAHTLLDRSEAMNPFKAWNFVFVPYCTGDLHGGNNVIAYSGGSDSKTYHHVGRANVRTYLARLAATFPAPGKLVVSGSGEGGYGSVINYDLFRRYFPNAEMALIDDSGPLLEGDDIPAAVRDAWFASWRLGEVVDPLCAGCRADLSGLMTALSARYSRDRMSLLSSVQDQALRGYFMYTSGAAFQGALVRMAMDVFDPTSNLKTFFVGGQTHAMLANPGVYNQGGTDLWTWLGEQLSGTGWMSLRP